MIVFLTRSKERIQGTVFSRPERKKSEAIFYSNLMFLTGSILLMLLAGIKSEARQTAKTPMFINRIYHGLISMGAVLR